MALPGASRAIVAPMPRVKPRGPSTFSRCRRHCLGPLYRWLASLLPSCIRHCTNQTLSDACPKSKALWLLHCGTVLQELRLTLQPQSVGKVMPCMYNRAHTPGRQCTDTSSMHCLSASCTQALSFACKHCGSMLQSAGHLD